MHSIIDNNSSDTEMNARIRDAYYGMMKCELFYGLALGECALRHADRLRTTPQSRNFSAAEEQPLTSMTVKTLSNLRTET